MVKEINITNYNDTEYEKDFWGTREYEDLIEKDVLNNLLSVNYNKFLDLGSGFGRLVPVYESKVKEATLLDYSDKLLSSAKQKWSEFNNLRFVQGSFYELPFKDASFDCGCSVRVLHHVEDVDKFFCELSRVLAKDAEFVLEVANKRNFLEIIRYILRRKGSLNPFSLKPENRSKKGLTYNFHPSYIKYKLEEHGFVIIKKVDSSLLRLPILKRIIGQSRLAFIERKIPFFIRKTGYTPSLFFKIKKN